MDFFKRLLCIRNIKTLRSYSNAVSDIKYERRIFSGIQPTGKLHLGNLLGAVKNWATLQDQTNCIFSIVDLHSLTLKNDPAELKNYNRSMAASLIACGINPEKCILFLQSQVPEHAELCWILQCQVTMPRLSHLPQFKEKSSALKDVPLGIYVYPVLQSADILAYKATEVPVGEDQIQHIQLTQHLAKNFNKKYQNIFPSPKVIIDTYSKIKSLRQPDKKMSKSELDPRSRIEISDSSDIIREKIKKAVTDCTSAVTFDTENRPGVSNLINIHSLLTGISIMDICAQSEGIETADYKMIVADAVIEAVKPIRERLNDLEENPDYIQKVLKMGNEKAREIASVTIQEVKKAVGLCF